ncbi:hypothetical protein [Sedimentibacter sp.]|uniref:hypothetical protein n=1 Tax=Sedimentibacter sp. TaxID=1960295 RepID=UPI0028AAE16D|nr:hypothetical protein [Sedimentibacter sp.]
MNIHIQNKEIWFENNPEIIEQLFNSINKYLQKDDLQFSHLIIDEEVIYDNFDNYIIENIESINKIEVIAITLTEMVNESLKSAEQYSKNAITIINKTAEEFYQKPDENTWSQLTDLFEGIQWIIQSLTEINSIESSYEVVSDYEIWNDYIQEVSKFNSIIFELENAVLNKDNVLIGDMLLHEIIPIFEAMVEKLELLISEAVDKDVN